MSYIGLGQVEDVKLYNSVYADGRMGPGAATPAATAPVDLHLEAKTAAQTAEEERKFALQQQLIAKKAAARAAMLQARAEEAAIAAQAAALAKATVRKEVSDQEQLIKGMLIGFIAGLLLS